METMLVILRTGLTLISKAEQLEEEPSCHLNQPYLVKDDGTLDPWPRYSNDDDVLLYSESLATMVEPTDDIRKKYKQVTE